MSRRLVIADFAECLGKKPNFTTQIYNIFSLNFFFKVLRETDQLGLQCGPNFSYFHNNWQFLWSSGRVQANSLWSSLDLRLLDKYHQQSWMNIFRFSWDVVLSASTRLKFQQLVWERTWQTGVTHRRRGTKLMLSGLVKFIKYYMWITRYP